MGSEMCIRDRPEVAREPAALQFMGDVILAQASTRGFQDAFAVLAVMAFLAIIPAIGMARMMKDLSVPVKVAKRIA